MEKGRTLSRHEKQDSSPLTLFYSYADKDEELREELEKHLSLLQRRKIIAGWHHHKILPGANKNQINDDLLSSAQIILLLISPDFLASDASYSEMQRALQRHKDGLAHVIPLLLRPVDWEQAPFAHLQALPCDGQPVTMWENRDLAFVNIAKGLRCAIEQWNASCSCDPNLHSYAKEELEYKERRKAQEDLQKALSTGSLEQIVAVYNP